MNHATARRKALPVLPPLERQPSWSVWDDITKDPLTGHTVAKDYFKAVSFYGGLAYLLGLTPAVVLLTKERIVLPAEPGITMILLAFGLAALKVAATYLNRQTTDANGNPLAVPDPPGDVPPNMSQTPSPPES